MTQSFSRSPAAQITEVSSEAVLLASDTLFWLLKSDDAGVKPASLQMSCSQLHSQGFFCLKDYAKSSHRNWKPSDILLKGLDVKLKSQF